MKNKILLVALTLAFVAPNAFAQNNNVGTAGRSQGSQPSVAQPGARIPTQTRLPYVRSKTEFKREILKKPPDLPDFPQYGGSAQFDTAAVAPNSIGGPTFNVVYHSKDPSTQVIQWYTSTLNQYKWSIGANNGKVISATKSGNSVSICTSTASRPGFHCDILITYRQKNP